ncbi:hypothetical protein RxyAA322_15710 [Rubrobacter xylanophilus]|uniref:Uncharacterized protein n=1 Tax=Rubrobacter xylanophilus TaxID=49319 RepID=A0A510HMQ5_9ACTN|nr:hypothetical protein [Rubrobacter xylanophilus]BBL79717.1 hypothetical protein RxyAA322_15710 [Rubrobacter xylanophilus]
MRVRNLLAPLKVFARTRYERVPDLVRLLIQRPAILAAVGSYESALLVSGRVEGRIKALAELKTSSLVGCPF